MPRGVADFAPRRFSTQEIAERDRVSMWREEFGRNLLRADIVPLSESPLHAEATLRVLPGLRTIVYGGSATRFQRTRATVADGDDFISIIVGENFTLDDPVGAFLKLLRQPVAICCYLSNDLGAA